MRCLGTELCAVNQMDNHRGITGKKRMLVRFYPKFSSAAILLKCNVLHPYLQCVSIDQLNSPLTKSLLNKRKRSLEDLLEMNHRDLFKGLGVCTLGTQLSKNPEVFSKKKEKVHF